MSLNTLSISNQYLVLYLVPFTGTAYDVHHIILPDFHRALHIYVEDRRKEANASPGIGI